MYRLLLILALLIVLYFLIKKAIREFNARALSQSGTAPPNQMIQDPVCRTYVPKGTAVAASIGGQTYYFCSEACARTFRKQLAG
ncbi:YHS domain-containing protein [Candidatus Nitrospira bockiana]